jgi:hypothetical protein
MGKQKESPKNIAQTFLEISHPGNNSTCVDGLLLSLDGEVSMGRPEGHFKWFDAFEELFHCLLDVLFLKRSLRHFEEIGRF